MESHTMNTATSRLSPKFSAYRADGRRTSVSLGEQLTTQAIAFFGSREAVAQETRRISVHHRPSTGVTLRNFVMAELNAQVTETSKNRPVQNVLPVVRPLPQAIASFGTSVLGSQRVGEFRTHLLAMTLDQFAALPVCRYQRDTKSHAKRAAKRHLGTLSPAQIRVAAALYNGALEMLDGHARVQLWQDGRLETPSSLLIVDVIECDTEEDLRNAYDSFDALPAAQRPKEKMFGAWRSLGFTPSSHFFSSRGAHKSAVTIAAGLKDPREAAAAMLPYIQVLESQGKGLGRGSRPMVVAAALIAVKKLITSGHSDRIADVSEFLQYAEKLLGQSDRKASKADAVQLLLTWMLRQHGKSGVQHQLNTVAHTLGAIQLWLKNPDPCWNSRHLKALTSDTFVVFSSATPSSANAKSTQATKQTRHRKAMPIARTPVALDAPATGESLSEDLKVPTLEEARKLRKPVPVCYN
jgi:hypothetical protein